jgi:phosphoribosylanthranilate isomerase
MYLPVIKICGITNFDDAKLAEKYGADIIGFIFAESKRKIELKVAIKISAKLKNVYKAGVFVNEKPEKINTLIKKLNLDFVQLCGNEKIKDIKSIKQAKVIKAIRVKDKKMLLKAIKKYAKYIYAFLLDNYKKGKYGGTGEKFNWNFIEIMKKFNKPYFVAGGLNPENIGELLIKYKPYGIDISSGVEEKPGKKSPEKIKNLFKNINKTIKFLQRSKNN